MKNKIIKIITEQARQHNVNLVINKENMAKNLKDIGIDSLLSLSCIVAIENELKIKLPDDILMKITTINELIATFEKYKK